MVSRLYNYLLLTKPRIGLLVLLTGAAGLTLEGSLKSDPGRFALVLAGLFLVSGSANALNQFFERDIDALMSRTRDKRPLPTGRLLPAEALAFAGLIGIAGVWIFAGWFNLFSAVLSLFAILFYGVFYTVWLKPRTHLNIVVGGVAGALAPMISWVAAAGSISLVPLVLFAIVFFWSPPHFWALALYMQDDYRRAGLPMLPLVRGDARTVDAILRYSLVLFAISLLLVPAGAGLVYAVASVGLGAILLAKTIALKKDLTPVREKALFGYSIVYLCLLFVAIIVDGLV
ncbi:MAG TPA: heme o synthase [Candidatus Glassbacteria bacterium]|nr:heme o synthase [Candidatus Glassbacteria bacterium]